MGFSLKKALTIPSRVRKSKPFNSLEDLGTVAGWALPGLTAGALAGAFGEGAKGFATGALGGSGGDPSTILPNWGNYLGGRLGVTQSGDMSSTMGGLNDVGQPAASLTYTPGTILSDSAANLNLLKDPIGALGGRALMSNPLGALTNLAKNVNMVKGLGEITGLYQSPQDRIAGQIEAENKQKRAILNEYLKTTLPANRRTYATRGTVDAGRTYISDLEQAQNAGAGMAAGSGIPMPRNTGQVDATRAYMSNLIQAANYGDQQAGADLARLVNVLNASSGDYAGLLDIYNAQEARRRQQMGLGIEATSPDDYQRLAYSIGG